MNPLRVVQCPRFACLLPAGDCAARYRGAEGACSTRGSQVTLGAPLHLRSCYRCPAGARIVEMLPPVAPVRRRRPGDVFRSLERARNPKQRTLLPFFEERAR